MAEGPDLIAATTSNVRLMAIDNCPGVPAQIGRVVYGAYQNDTRGIEMKNDHTMQRNINEAIFFGGGKSETSVWHFSTSPAVHHFVVIPWYKQDYLYGHAYTVLMAYEGKYKLGQYMKGVDSEVPRNGDGYKAYWTPAQLIEMLSGLLGGDTANASWKKYFDPISLPDKRATKITCYKYRTISLEKAVENVNKLGGVCSGQQKPDKKLSTLFKFNRAFVAQS